MELDFLHFLCLFDKITTLVSLFWQLQALLEQFGSMYVVSKQDWKSSVQDREASL